MPCQNLRKYDSWAGNESSISVLIWFDEIEADIVVNLKGIIESSEHANNILHDNGSAENLIATYEKSTKVIISLEKKP